MMEREMVGYGLRREARYEGLVGDANGAIVAGG